MTDRFRVAKRLAITSFAVLAVGAGASATYAAASGSHDPEAETASEQAYTDAHRQDAAVTQAAAEAVALGRHPGTAFDAHLQTEQSVMTWEVKIDDGRQVHEVQIDPRSGEIVSDQPDE